MPTIRYKKTGNVYKVSMKEYLALKRVGENIELVKPIRKRRKSIFDF